MTAKHVVGPLVALVSFLRRHRVLRCVAYVLMAVVLLFSYVLVHAGIAGSFVITVDGNSVAEVVLVLLVVAAVPYLLYRLAKLLAGIVGRIIDRAATAHRSFLPVGACRSPSGSCC